MKTLTAHRLRYLLSYNRASGTLKWKVSLSHRTPVGSVAGSINEDSLRVVQIGGRKFLAHRLIIFHQTGRWPTKNIKFKNGNRSDCRWKNLIL
jgi:HNH endonuclease